METVGEEEGDRSAAITTSLAPPLLPCSLHRSNRHPPPPPPPRCLAVPPCPELRLRRSAANHRITSKPPNAVFFSGTGEPAPHTLSSSAHRRLALAELTPSPLWLPGGRHGIAGAARVERGGDGGRGSHVGRRSSRWAPARVLAFTGKRLAMGKTKRLHLPHR
jgi:hypothetical protein